MELEGYNRPTCNKLCASSNYASIVVGVIRKLLRRRVLSTTRSICRGEIFPSPEFRANFQRELPLFSEVPKFAYNKSRTCVYTDRISVYLWQWCRRSMRWRCRCLRRSVGPLVTIVCFTAYVNAVSNRYRPHVAAAAAAAAPRSIDMRATSANGLRPLALSTVGGARSLEIFDPFNIRTCPETSSPRLRPLCTGLLPGDATLARYLWVCPSISLYLCLSVASWVLSKTMNGSSWFSA